MHLLSSLAQKVLEFFFIKNQLLFLRWLLLVEQKPLRLTAGRGPLNLSQDLEMRLFRMTNEEKTVLPILLEVDPQLGHLTSFEAESEEFPHANPIRPEPQTGFDVQRSGFLSLFYDTEKVCHSDLLITTASVWCGSAVLGIKGSHHPPPHTHTSSPPTDSFSYKLRRKLNIPDQLRLSTSSFTQV